MILKVKLFITLFFFILITQLLIPSGFQEAVKLFEKGDYNKSEQFFIKYFQEKVNTAESAYYLGTIYLIKEDLKKSQEFLTHAINLEKENSKYHHRLGQTYGQYALQAGLLKKFKFAKKAKKLFEKAVNLDNRNISARWDLFNYYLRAPSIAGGSDKKAVIQAEAIKKMDLKRGHEAFFLIYNDQKEYSKAETELLKTLELSDNKRDIYMRLGFFYQEQKQYTKAKNTFLKIYKEVNPQDQDALYQLGRTTFFSGKDLLQGIKYFKEYLTRTPRKGSPTLADAHWRIGKIYEELKQNTEAIFHYKTALKWEPKHESAKKSLKKIK